MQRSKGLTRGYPTPFKFWKTDAPVPRNFEKSVPNPPLPQKDLAVFGPPGGEKNEKFNFAPNGGGIKGNVPRAKRGGMGPW